MTIQEARLAVELNAICSHRGITYYAYGMQYIHPYRKAPSWAIILGSRGANSIVNASIEETSVLNWNAPRDFVEQKLSQMKEQKGNP